jgi:hypothetical protein
MATSSIQVQKKFDRKTEACPWLHIFALHSSILVDMHAVAKVAQSRSYYRCHTAAYMSHMYFCNAVLQDNCARTLPRLGLLKMADPAPGRRTAKNPTATAFRCAMEPQPMLQTLFCCALPSFRTGTIVTAKMTSAILASAFPAH